MLQQCPQATDLNDAWLATKCQVQIPDSWLSVLFDKSGPKASVADDDRVYNRYEVRAKGVLMRRDANFGCYTLDISRQGVGFLSPVLLLPNEIVHLQLPRGYALSLQVVRCVRHGEQCYECGTKIARGRSTTA